MSYTNIIAACWLVFVLYWSISAIGIKKDVPEKRGKEFALRTITVLVAIIVAANGQAINAFLVRLGLPAEFSSVIRTVGVVAALVGLCVAIWARYHLGRNWSSHPTMKQEHELVTHGPYHWVRHPIYTGMSLMLIGSGLALGATWLFICVAGIAIFVWRIHIEEGLMLQLFPNQYPDYKQHTKALVPFVW
jgi:protein-S-isoprenylcysteine O-methyltransferase Ste14